MKVGRGGAFGKQDSSSAFYGSLSDRTHNTPSNLLDYSSFIAPLSTTKCSMPSRELIALQLSSSELWATRIKPQPCTCSTWVCLQVCPNKLSHVFKRRWGESKVTGSNSHAYKSPRWRKTSNSFSCKILYFCNSHKSPARYWAAHCKSWYLRAGSLTLKHYGFSGGYHYLHWRAFGYLG